MSERILYIDDRLSDLDRYAHRLEYDGAEVIPKRPTDNPLSFVRRSDRPPHMFVLDYDLAQAQIEYKGSTLAGILKDRFPDVPIVLLTRKSLIGEVKRSAVENRFDEVIFKSELEGNPKAVKETLASLAAGFERLRKIRNRNWAALLNLLAIREKSDEDLLLKAGPPTGTQLGEALQEDDPSWRPAAVARWVRFVVLQYPGILYDELHAATALGLSVESFNRKSVAALFEPGRYRGIFGANHRRWWRSRLFTIAARVVGDAPVGALAASFRTALERQRRFQLRPSVCVYSRTSPADCVCFILKKPVKREFSLPYHPDSRPAVMDEARVSYKAIRESNDVFEEYFDEQHRQLVRQVQEAKE